MTDGGEIEINGAYVNINNTSTISGIASASLNIVGYGTYVYGSNISVFGDGQGAGFEVDAGQNRVIGLSGLIVDANLSVSTITDVSTINGSAYPFAVTTIGDIATGGFVYTTTSNVLMGVGATAFSIDSGNALTVGSATANTAIVFASTIMASTDGLNIFETAGSATIKLQTDGKVKINDGLTTITDGTGLLVGPEGASITFPLDPTSAFNVGEIINVSTINGSAYPIPVKQAVYYKSAAQNLTSGNTDITFDLSGAWNNTAGYITHTPGTAAFTVVQAGVYTLEFNTTVLANDGTFSSGVNRVCAIDITRSPNGEHAVISTSGLQATTANYAQSVNATYYLEAGDVINMRLNSVFSGGSPTPPQASGVSNTFDYNTFFTWRYIS
jgi:hypothetical protein